MREIVIISGKGGTGKTSLTASFAALAGKAVLADCDVDAADLHLVLAPTIRRREEFRCGHEAVIRQEDCIGCGACLARCRFGAVVRRLKPEPGSSSGGAQTVRESCEDGCKRSGQTVSGGMIQEIRKTCGQQNDHSFVIDTTGCEGCGVCVWSCPVKAIDFRERLCGEWYVSDTRCGPLVHARLIPGGENSGKLVSKVREVAREQAKERNADYIIVDGPPGVGCAVIASLTGASKALVVTEPTLSGAHDMARVLELTRHFKIPTAVCVNKWDLNPEMTTRIESDACKAGATIAGRVRYDKIVTSAQLQGLSVVEMDSGITGDDIRTVWKSVNL